MRLHKVSKVVLSSGVQLAKSVKLGVIPGDGIGPEVIRHAVAALEQAAPKVNFENKDTSISDQIQYKMILDMDGWSSTWSATVWKMYSGSVLLKTKSKWKQWYYHKLEPWVHYVPVKDDFSDLNDKIEWCLHNERECIKITENAKRFVDKHLTWDQVKKDTLAAVRSSIV
jgi:hypothetical protein